MKETPILFSSEMVRAIIAGSKTMTRRVVKKQPNSKATHFKYSPVWKLEPWVAEFQYHDSPCWEITDSYKCPYGKPGDLLWVRETWFRGEDDYCRKEMYYRADRGEVPLLVDGDGYMVVKKDGSPASPWKPSIHMPKTASRIWLQITDIRVERLQSITEKDALAEGIHQYEDGTFKNYFDQSGMREQDGVEAHLATGSFCSLWASINGIDSWRANPWTWVVSFRVLSTSGRPVNLGELCAAL